MPIGVRVIPILLSLTLASACEVDTTTEPRCGDGVAQAGEECDGTDVLGRTCISTGFYGGALACDEDCMLDYTGCTAVGSCGDDVIQDAFGESCDGETIGGVTCESLGHGGGELACAADCTYDVSGCAVCGDGAVTAPFEDCDGSDLQGSTCESLGYYGGTLACDEQTCGWDLTDCAAYGICGDNELQTNREACDGPEFGGATCESFGYYGGVLACNHCALDFTPCEAHGWCGDGIVAAWIGEECDLNNFGGKTCRSLRHWSGTAVCNGMCQITGCLDIIQLSVGTSHACAVVSDGTIRCWGDNTFGQLGDGTTVDRLSPAIVPGLNGIVQVGVGQDFTCALDQSQRVHCWGRNVNGQLGDGTTTDRMVPMVISTMASAEQLAVGDDFACASRSNGSVSCWGSNAFGQLGDGTTTYRTTPVYVMETAGFNYNASKVTAGARHACGVSVMGAVSCWGDNTFGQLGDGTTVKKHNPVVVAQNQSAVDAGAYHTCAIQLLQGVSCWGSNAHGQLGDGTTVGHTSPVAVVGLSSVTAVAAGFNHTCALLQNESVMCWGENVSGQLGDGTTFDRTAPVAVTGLATVRSLSAADSTCAVNLYGDAHCWGSNTSGQLGDGTTINRPAPTAVSE
mgnify:CR=1 FL=1